MNCLSFSALKTFKPCTPINSLLSGGQCHEAKVQRKPPTRWISLNLSWNFSPCSSAQWMLPFKLRGNIPTALSHEIDPGSYFKAFFNLNFFVELSSQKRKVKWQVLLSKVTSSEAPKKLSGVKSLLKDKSKLVKKRPASPPAKALQRYKL